DDLEDMDIVFGGMYQHLLGKPRPSMLEMPGITPEQVGDFFDAAASFYKEMPWKTVADDGTIKVECDRFQSGPWYAVVMGQSGLTMGLALYDDLEALRRMWAGDRGDRDNARQSVATTVTFGEEWDIPVADLEAAKKHGWPVAR